ncbi:hypothetical protein [Acinetobacter sp. YH12153]|uniref:hypothetical protein n=1 Tax=Acinetobacter sp. YH12153 TaxID=2601133 RepID=UPI0015D1771D|nr:hypothetical protein [Acinetobacter sp. YH12153]
MNQTEPKKKRYVYLFLISLVVLLVCSNILAFQFAYILPNWLAPNILVPGLLLLASFFYIIWYVSPSLDFKNHFVKALAAVMVSLAMICGSTYLMANADKLRDIHLYEQANLKDAQSSEFAVIKALGKENNVLIRLGNKTAWAISRLNIPNSSGASLTVENGYCKLNYNGDSIRDFHGALAKKLPGGKSDLDIAKITIMVHELAHCLDIKRDYVTFNPDRIDPKNPQNIIISTQAIDPKYRTTVKPDDVETYLDAGGKSTLWKEAFADVYSIGYLYIEHPEHAELANKGLMAFRAKYASLDPTHNTSCWLSTIEKSVKPTKRSELITWTDQIRSNSQCSM